MSIRDKADTLANDCKEAILVSVSEQGFPRPCVLSKIESDGINSFYVATGLTGVKCGHFKLNPKAGACFWRGQDSVTLTGSVAFVTDMATKKRLWLDWFIHHFPGGVDDPNYAVLRFDADEATIWIDSEFETIQVNG